MKIPKLRRNPDGRAFIAIPRGKGKRVYFGKYGTKDAKTKYEDWLRDYTASGGRVATPSDQVIQTVAAEYLKEIRPLRKPASYKNYRRAVFVFCDYMGDIKGSEINQMNFRAFTKHLANATYTKGGQKVQMSRQRSNDIISKVKGFIKWAASHNLVPMDVWEKVRIVDRLKIGSGREIGKKAAISWEVLQETLPYLASTAAAMCQIQFLCGMRPGEVCQLRRDFDRTGVMVGDVKVWLYEFKEHKMARTGQSLIKAIPPAAQRLLEQWESRGDCGEYFFSPRQAIRDNFGWNTGPWVLGQWPEQDRVLLAARDHYLSNSLADLVQAGVKRAREAHPHLPAWSPNQLRHGMATFIREKFGIEEAGIYAGHKNVDTTLIYASNTTKKLVAVAAAFEAALQTQTNDSQHGNDQAVNQEKSDEDR